ncbi:MAG: hypothetical protein M3137_09740 [Actinomycetota bacterium]|nr:hypothetical protein [Actinomycetota bacterium]
MTDPIVVVDEGTTLAFSFADMLRYSGPGSPAGVALAHQAMHGAFPILAPEGSIERREITIETAFRGPGARDGFELVTRASTDERYVIDLSLARPDRGTTLESFVFRMTYQSRSVTLLLREGLVTHEFVALAGTDSRNPEDERRLTEMKRELAERLLVCPPVDVFDTGTPPG